MLAIERVMDAVAAEVGPRSAGGPPPQPLWRRGPQPDALPPGGRGQCRAAADRRAGRLLRLRRPSREIEAFNKTSPVLKKGIALTPVKFGISFTTTHLNQAGALIHLYADGSIMLNHGGTEMGQGLHIKVAQIVAKAFQVDIGKVKITSTVTDKVPNTSATAASSGADLNGMAALNAAETIKARLVEFAAKKWN
jgi:xanthine dehydrogenase large subunit